MKVSIVRRVHIKHIIRQTLTYPIRNLNTGKLVHISESHPIFSSRVATSGKIPVLKGRLVSLVTTGICRVTNMRATGVPSNIELHRKVDHLENQIVDVDKKFEDRLENRLPKLVTDNVLENIRVDGAQQLSVNDMRALIQETVRTLNVSEAAPSSSTSSVEPATGTTSDNTFASFCWGGQLGRPVPEDWSFPRSNVKSICEMFIFGISLQEMRIRPFRLIKGKTLRRKDQQYFYKSEYVFNCIIDKAVQENDELTKEYIFSRPLAEWDMIFDHAFANVLEDIAVKTNKRVRKPGDICITTFYDKLHYG